MKAEKRAVNGSVTNQANTILLNSFKSTSLVLLVLAQPTNTTEPTLQCVVLIGRPNFDAIRTVVADPISIVNPLNKNLTYIIFCCTKCFTVQIKQIAMLKNIFFN